MATDAQGGNTAPARKSSVTDEAAGDGLEDATRRRTVIAGEEDCEEKIKSAADEAADQDGFQYWSLRHDLSPEA